MKGPSVYRDIRGFRKWTRPFWKSIGHCALLLWIKLEGTLSLWSYHSIYLSSKPPPSKNVGRFHSFLSMYFNAFFLHCESKDFIYWDWLYYMKKIYLNWSIIFKTGEFDLFFFGLVKVFSFISGQLQFVKKKIPVIWCFHYKNQMHHKKSGGKWRETE